MNITKNITMILLTACLMSAGAAGRAQSVEAAGINSSRQAEDKALKKVPDADVIETNRDNENGELVYEIKLVKGGRKYELTYRASDAKLIEYEWEKRSVSAGSGGKQISEKKCRTLAENKVKNGTILKISKKLDDGIYIYKVKMQAGSKTYTLKYHAGTGALIEYQWKLKVSSNAGSEYIGLSKAKNLALDAVPGGTVAEAKLDMDDGVMIYEIEVRKGNYKYELKIDAVTGTIIEQDKERDD